MKKRSFVHCRGRAVFGLALTLVLPMGAGVRALGQQPAEPSDINPVNGEVVYLIDQASGLEADLNNGSTTAGDKLLLETRSFTSLTQRWALTRVGSAWAISNLSDGLCLDASTGAGGTTTVQNACAPAPATQQWTLTATADGYATVTNRGTGLLLDASGTAAGATLTQTAASGTATQSQQWLLRPAFFRGVDNGLLEKQEEERAAAGVPWWQDAGQAGDVLAILKNHGVNLVRVRPTSAPPYATLGLNGSSGIPATCTGNGCYAETDAVDLDLAKRAKQQGMAVELTLLFDGGSSDAIPGAWSSDSLTQAETDLYNYVKAEVEAYRSAGAMPDMVTIGNEVDTGFLGSLGSPTGSNFGPFAALEKQGMQAVLDAASDTSLGPALPAPLRCIHITPAWDLTNFFGYVNSNGIPYDAMCQSYYPFDHGPLTAAQASASNPNNQPVEQTALTNAATSIGKPIFVIEAAEHYESGFEAADPWYAETMAGQRQFFIDLTGVLKGLPNHLGMGLEDWDPAGVNLPKSGGYTNGDGTTDATYVWNGLTLFDNADTSGSSQSSAPTYSAVLEAVDALGGRVDPTLSYKLVNVASGQVLETVGTGTLGTVADSGVESPAEQWAITSDGDGTFQIANENSGSGQLVLDGGGSTTAGSTVGAAASSSGSATQAWNILTTGNGTWALVNKLSGLVLATGGSAIEQLAPTSANADWITPASQAEQWQIVPVYLSSGTVVGTPPSFSLAGTPSSLTLSASGSGTVNLTLTPVGGYAGTIKMSCTSTLANVGCTFSPSSYTADGSNTVLTGTVAMASSGSALARPVWDGGGPQLAWMLLPVGLLAVGARRRRGGSLVLLALLLSCAVSLTACSGGGGSGGGGGGGGGTTPVTGTVTLTAAGSTGNVTQSMTVTVTVE
ncbi:MAG TPA: glycosyl hydrolase 53 family protein [Acidobacteriaceae bacterium]|jgi:arabinogalactan endo-1,4-beta-galactosidase|nr:glycosyl hydrolase 53 family protein [Acidobacteriaceae bacterium]